MIYYQNGSSLTHLNSEAFNTTYEPGQRAPFGGIYKCKGCGHEIGIAKGHFLPPQNHHQHANYFVSILWQPVVIHN